MHYKKITLPINQEHIITIIFSIDQMTNTSSVIIETPRAGFMLLIKMQVLLIRFTLHHKRHWPIHYCRCLNWQAHSHAISGSQSQRVNVQTIYMWNLHIHINYSGNNSNNNNNTSNRRKRKKKKIIMANYTRFFIKRKNRKERRLTKCDTRYK